MRLLVLGSGSAFSTIGNNAAYALDGRLLVDCGAPAHLLLPRAGVDVDGISTVFLTHFHADHAYGLPVLLGARALNSPEPRPLRLAGPPGTLEYVLRMVQVGFGGQLTGIIRERLRLSSTVLQDGGDVEIDGYRVRAHAVVHSAGPSLSYAISDASGATVGFSGDSTLCAGLRRTLALSHLAVCECTGWDEPVPSHLSAPELAGLIREYPGCRFLLSHLFERRTMPGALVAHDGLALEVEAPGAPLPEPPPSLRSAAATRH